MMNESDSGLNPHWTEAFKLWNGTPKTQGNDSNVDGVFGNVFGNSVFSAEDKPKVITAPASAKAVRDKIRNDDRAMVKTNLNNGALKSNS